MDFDKESFSKILIKIKNNYGSINKMAEKTGVTTAYLSKLIRLMYNNAPSPEILRKIANNSNNIISYAQLMEVCGYIDVNRNMQDEMLRKKVEFIIQQSNKLIKSGLTENQILTLQNIICLNFSSEEYYDSLESFLDTLEDSAKLTVLKVLQKMLKYIQNFSTEQLELAKNLKVEAHELIEKANTFKELHEIEKKFSNRNTQFYMCPVYGNISAGQPNWAEENIEGRIPVPSTGEISNPEECFYLKVSGESMNKLVKNGAYSLIHRQDIVEDGEVAVVLVNGYDATLKKFSKQGDFVILEPMSDVTDDPDIKTQIYDKNTSIKILGKYIGKFEMN